MTLFIRLTVNGEIKQNGNTSQFIFTPEEQIAYRLRHFPACKTGNFFNCGTCGGVGQEDDTCTFLNVGDVMETEIEGLTAICGTGFVAEAS